MKLPPKSQRCKYVARIGQTASTGCCNNVLLSEASCSFVSSRYAFHCVKRDLPIASLSNLLSALADEAVNHPNDVCSAG